ncbi:MAG TPA: TonB-dependent receptor [Caulobacteraceae bacterium]
MKQRLASGASAAVIAICAGAAAPHAFAADAQGSATAVQEVIVTAQKREQRLQDVPVAVTVLNTKQLERLGVRSVKDLTLLAPGLNATTNADESTTTVRIRGIGTVADNAGLEDAVGIYIDGVYRPRNGVGFNDLGELSDVEVLKGPQGTLFGKNTVAGVILINTQRPQFVFGGDAQFDIQNYNGWGGSATVTGPIVGNVLAGRLYFSAHDRDGYLPVIQPPGGGIPSQDDEHMYTVRGQLLYAPTEDFKVNVIGDYTRRDDHCCVAVAYQNGFPATLQNIFFPGSIIDPVSKNNVTAAVNVTPIEHIRDEGVSAQIDWKTPWLGGARLTSITALRDWKDNSETDSDYTLADLLNTVPFNVQEFGQFSEELRLNGEAGRLTWQVGAFYSHEDLDVFAPLSFGTGLTEYLAVLTAGAGPLATGTYNPPGGAFPAGEGARDTYHQREHSFSAYTQDDFKITDHLIFTGGVRFTTEHKALHSLYNNNDTSGTCAHFEAVATELEIPLNKATLGIPCLDNPAFKGLETFQAFTENDITGTAKLTYKFSDTAMVYGSYSRGNLVAGFNLAEVTTAVGNNPNASLVPDPDTTFPAEYVDAFEIGTKAQLFDHRLLLTAAAFYQKYQNFQLNAFTGTQFIESTIPQAQSLGAEGDAYFALTPDLTLNAGVTYADTTYPNSAANRAALGDNTAGSPFFQSTPLFRLPGSHPSFAPLWSLVGGLSYRHPIMNGLEWTFDLDGKYQSGYNVGSDHDPVKFQPGFGIVNARMGIGGIGGKWSVEVWATNLFNTHYSQAIFDGVLQTFSVPQPSSIPSLNNYDYFPGQPRFWGATLRVKY